MAIRSGKRQPKRSQKFGSERLGGNSKERQQNVPASKRLQFSSFASRLGRSAAPQNCDNSDSA
jgi:hypothetical protein